MCENVFFCVRCVYAKWWNLCDVQTCNSVSNLAKHCRNAKNVCKRLQKWYYNKESSIKVVSEVPREMSHWKTKKEVVACQHWEMKKHHLYSYIYLRKLPLNHLGNQWWDWSCFAQLNSLDRRYKHEEWECMSLYFMETADICTENDNGWQVLGVWIQPRNDTSSHRKTPKSLTLEKACQSISHARVMLIPKEDFQKRFQQWQEHRNKYVCARWEYF